GKQRYRMHPILADWAIQRHQAGVDDARRRLNAWHFELAKPAAAEALETSRDQRDNWAPLLQLWQNAADDREQLRASMQYVLPLLIDHGDWNSALAGLERVLEIYRDTRSLAPLAQCCIRALQDRR